MSKLILADGSPRYSMISMLIGAIVNTILDPIFIFTLDMGMRGHEFTSGMRNVDDPYVFSNATVSSDFCMADIGAIGHIRSIP